MKILIIAGARPNFMKIAPIIHSLNLAKIKCPNIIYRLVHTGQHFDEKMSRSFFRELEIPEPDINLECGGGSQAEQTAAIMIKFEKELIENPTDLVLVVGDVTSTMACALVARKLNIKVAHVEAGIRSGDWSMPEEINRVVTDSISNYFFTTTIQASENLIALGFNVSNIYFVGNTMIDTLLKQMNRFKKPELYDVHGLKSSKYFVLTLHRPGNVDDENTLAILLYEIIENANKLPVVFPVHPRTRKNLSALTLSFPNLILTEPLSYLEFNYLVKNAKAVITDSGGITEETTVMGVPCITLRNSTERPETCIVGTNELIGTNPRALKPALEKLFRGEWKKGGIPDLWDGKTSDRIVNHLLEILKT